MRDGLVKTTDETHRPPLANCGKLAVYIAPCVTVKLCPATVRVPVLGARAVLAATEYFTVPLPLPLAPEAMVIQLSLLVAVQLQPAGAVTSTLPAPPLLSKDSVVPEIEKAQEGGGAASVVKVTSPDSARFPAASLDSTRKWYRVPDARPDRV